MPGYLRITLFRPLGIGMLIGGAITGIVLALPLIVSAIRSMQTAAKMKTAASARRDADQAALRRRGRRVRRAAGHRPFCRRRR